jgi:hypothetical protein
MLQPVAKLGGLHASRQLGEFLRAHDETPAAQERLLGELCAAHADTAFGRDHGLASVRSYGDFARQVPLGNYETLRPYMDRVLAGETEALLPPGERVLMFSLTSGTTGRPKYIPVTRRFLADMRRGWNAFGIRLLNDEPGLWLRHILQISSPMRESDSTTGLPCGAISGLLAATQKRIVRWMYPAPAQVGLLASPTDRCYALLRYGAMRDVAIITTANPSSTIKLIETGQAHAERLVRDIRDGTCTLPDNELAGKSLPRPGKNARLARRIEEGIARDGVLLPRHFWNVGALTNWTGGTLRLYLPRLRELFEGAVVRDIGLLASEGRFTIPLANDEPAGVAEVLGNFLEFIPVERRDQADPPVLRAHELEEGGEYLLVATNWAGLWRYNMDDRVRVVGFFGRSPVLEFLSRGFHTSSITGEKITEHQVVEAMRLACRQFDGRIERFELQGRFAPLPYYELRLELCDGLCEAKLAGAMDAHLARLNGEYAAKRSSERLGPIRPVVLAAGTLDRLERQRVSERRGRSEQYKHQYLLTEVLEPDAPAGASQAGKRNA